MEPTEQVEQPKKHTVFKVVVAVMGVLVILYFAAENLFIDIAVWLLILGVPLGSLAIILSPLWITKRIFRVKQFTAKSVLTAFPFILILTFTLWKLDILLFKWLVSQAGRGFLQSF